MERNESGLATANDWASVISSKRGTRNESRVFATNNARIQRMQICTVTVDRVSQIQALLKQCLKEGMTLVGELPGSFM
jgi:hypothetical protein